MEGKTDSSKSRDADFNTLSGHKQDICYFPENPEDNYMEKLSFPGDFPYTGVFIQIFTVENYGQ